MRRLMAYMMIGAHVLAHVPCYGTSMSSAEMEQIQSRLPRAHTAPSAVAPQGSFFTRYEELLEMHR